MLRRYQYDRYWHILMYSSGTTKSKQETPPQVMYVFPGPLRINKAENKGGCQEYAF